MFKEFKVALNLSTVHTFCSFPFAFEYGQPLFLVAYSMDQYVVSTTSCFIPHC